MSDTPAQEPDLALGRKTSRRVRLWLFLLAAPALLCIVWLIFPTLALSQAQEHLFRRESTAALSWLPYADFGWTTRAAAAFYRARAYRQLGQMDQVKQQLTVARSLGFSASQIEREQWLALAQSGQLAESERHFPELLMNSAGDMADICEALANGLMRHHREPDALRIVDAWLKDQPDSVRGLRVRIQLLTTLNRQKLAELDLRHWGALEPESTDAKTQLASILINQQRMTEAVPLLQAVLAREPNHLPALLDLARCSDRLGQSAEAGTLLKQALQLAPDDPVVLLLLAKWEFEQDQIEASQQHLQRYLNRNPNLLDARYLHGQILQAQGRMAEARQELEYVVRCNQELGETSLIADRAREGPLSADEMVRIGKAYLASGQNLLALSWLYNVLDADPRNREAHRLLAEYYRRESAFQPKLAAQAEQHQKAVEAADTSLAK